jgi:two-component system, OmpR family, sensor kinase
MALLCTAVLAAAGIGVYVSTRVALLNTLDDSLLRIAIAEASSAVDEPSEGVHVHDIPPGEAGARADPDAVERLIAVRNAAGDLVAHTANLLDGPALELDRALEARALAGATTVADMQRGPQRYRGIYYPIRDEQDRPLVMIVAVPTARQQELLNSLAAALVAILLAGATVGGVGALALARRMTRPIENIASSARAFGESNLAHRIPDVAPDAELHELTLLLNAMFGRLQQAFDTQRRAIELQKRFVADASHELRSPLSNLRGTVEVTLRHPRDAAEYRSALGVALSEIERLSRLVAGLLTLSRADAGALEGGGVACDLAEIARDSIGAHAARAADAGVAVTLDADPAPVPVTGSADRLRQVVDNLLDNALQHAPSGSAVRIGVGRDSGEARLTVADDGPGLSPEDCARVFDRFYRVDSARDRRSGGTGLGLAIVRAIVEAHGGTVAVESSPGCGAKFSVRLPRTAMKETMPGN